MGLSVSVIIPTVAGREESLRRCLSLLVPQLRSGDEVVVSVDGEGLDAGSLRASVAWVLTGPRGGPAAARNRALDAAGGDLVLFLNDDVEPAGDLLDAHRARHADEDARVSVPSMFVGDAPWARWDDETLLDRVVSETSLVFFYNGMRGSGDRDRDWGFRHAWTLNLSVRRALVERFDDRLRYPMFDDVEWAFRVCGVAGAAVRYAPEASVVHRHRLRALDVLRREALVGHQAVVLSYVRSGCALAVFGDRLSDEVGAAELAEAAAGFDRFAELEHVRACDALGDCVIEEAFEDALKWRWAVRRFSADLSRAGVGFEECFERVCTALLARSRCVVTR